MIRKNLAAKKAEEEARSAPMTVDSEAAPGTGAAPASSAQGGGVAVGGGGAAATSGEISIDFDQSKIKKKGGGGPVRTPGEIRIQKGKLTFFF